ncbi:MAG: hypothetical protein ACHBN1_12485 [Heteroscytonema crispum UTEX LB 1556]
MGKYDKIFNSQEASEESLSPEEAVAAVAVVSAAADSSIEEVDAEILASILWDFEVFEEYSEDEVSEIVDRLLGIAKKAGLGPLLNTAIESLSEDLVLDAFAAGVMMVLDEEELIVPKGKMPFLKQLQSVLQLEEEEAQEVISEVIAAFEEAEYEDETVVDEGLILDVYESPIGNFTVQVPVEPQQGGRVQSQEGVVGFSDDFGTLLRIDYYPLPLEQQEEIESVGQEKYLQSVLLEKYVPQAIVANLPTAKVEHTEYLDDMMEGAYFVLVNMPQGSTISKQESNGNASRLDAYRGLIAFINDEFLYIVSSQRNFFKGETPGSIADEAQSMKQKILEFVETIEFT